MNELKMRSVYLNTFEYSCHVRKIHLNCKPHAICRAKISSGDLSKVDAFAGVSKYLPKVRICLTIFIFVRKLNNFCGRRRQWLGASAWRLGRLGPAARPWAGGGGCKN